MENLSLKTMIIFWLMAMACFATPERTSRIERQQYGFNLVQSITATAPTGQPTCQPSHQPTIEPSQQPSSQPTAQPQRLPTRKPSSQPSHIPSRQPSKRPTRCPSSQPSHKPSSQPTRHPRSIPTNQPTRAPSTQPTFYPTRIPTRQPSSQPSRQPSSEPSGQPSGQPSTYPTIQPSHRPTSQPIGKPSSQPTRRPSHSPSDQPTTHPSRTPSRQPIGEPSSQPSERPTRRPSSQPNCKPTRRPSKQPYSHPSAQPSTWPSRKPSSQPGMEPSCQPTLKPLSKPTNQPTRDPSTQPTMQPNLCPSAHPTSIPTSAPSKDPTKSPTDCPTRQPSTQPSKKPTHQPNSVPTKQPTVQPSSKPTRQPIHFPTSKPTRQPWLRPTSKPSTRPSSRPTRTPSTEPSSHPSSSPSCEPTSIPTNALQTQVTLTGSFTLAGQGLTLKQFASGNGPACIQGALFAYMDGVKSQDIIVTTFTEPTLKQQSTNLGGNSRQKQQLTGTTNPPIGIITITWQAVYVMERLGFPNVQTSVNTISTSLLNAQNKKGNLLFFTFNRLSHGQFNSTSLVLVPTISSSVALVHFANPTLSPVQLPQVSPPSFSPTLFPTISATSSATPLPAYVIPVAAAGGGVVVIIIAVVVYFYCANRNITAIERSPPPMPVNSESKYQYAEEGWPDDDQPEPSELEVDDTATFPTEDNNVHMSFNDVYRSSGKQEVGMVYEDSPMIDAAKLRRTASGPSKVPSPTLSIPTSTDAAQLWYLTSSSIASQENPVKNRGGLTERYITLDGRIRETFTRLDANAELVAQPTTSVVPRHKKHRDHSSSRRKRSSSPSDRRAFSSSAERELSKIGSLPSYVQKQSRMDTPQTQLPNQFLSSSAADSQRSVRDRSQPPIDRSGTNRLGNSGTRTPQYLLPGLSPETARSSQQFRVDGNALRRSDLDAPAARSPESLRYPKSRGSSGRKRRKEQVVFEL